MQQKAHAFSQHALWKVRFQLRYASTFTTYPRQGALKNTHAFSQHALYEIYVWLGRALTFTDHPNAATNYKSIPFLIADSTTSMHLAETYVVPMRCPMLEPIKTCAEHPWIQYV